MARPLAEIDWDQVDKLCAIHCTGEEQAAVLGVDYDTLNRACKREHKVSFAEYFKQKASHGKMSLRRKQYTTAMDGNTTMLVWLGKNWLGQRDQPESEPVDLQPIVIQRADEADQAPR
jgi:hypothetical protein